MLNINQLAGRSIRIVARDIREKDAVGNFSLQLADLFKSAGADVSCFAENGDFGEILHPMDAFWTSVMPQDLVFFNFSIEDPALDRVAPLKCWKILYFHGITPPNFFTRQDVITAGLASRGLEQRPLAAGFDLLMANSQVSARQLLEGIGEDARRQIGSMVIAPPIVGVRWPYISAETVELPVRSRLILFVGRVSPHKGIETLLETIAAMRSIDSGVHLALVGCGSDDYIDRTIRHTREGVPDGVTFLAGISDGAIKFLYETADAFLTFTGHEGYCVPVADAVLLDRPIFSRPDPAVVELLDGCGTLINDDLSARQRAELILGSLGDPAALQEKAHQRAERRDRLAEEVSGETILLSTFRVLAGAP